MIGGERRKSSVVSAKPKETISEQARNAEIGVRATADVSVTGNTSPSDRKGLQSYLHGAQKERNLMGEKEVRETPENAVPDKDDQLFSSKKGNKRSRD